jgi:hypothetical protein
MVEKSRDNLLIDRIVKERQIWLWIVVGTAVAIVLLIAGILGNIESSRQQIYSQNRKPCQLLWRCFQNWRKLL